MRRTGCLAGTMCGQDRQDPLGTPTLRGAAFWRLGQRHHHSRASRLAGRAPTSGMPAVSFEDAAPRARCGAPPDPRREGGCAPCPQDAAHRISLPLLRHPWAGILEITSGRSLMLGREQPQAQRTDALSGVSPGSSDRHQTGEVPCRLCARVGEHLLLNVARSTGALSSTAVASRRTGVRPPTERPLPPQAPGFLTHEDSPGRGTK
jgi:hypothetical protein